MSVTAEGPLPGWGPILFSASAGKEINQYQNGSGPLNRVGGDRGGGGGGGLPMGKEELVL